MTTKKLNLYQKLIEIRKGVDFLKKEAQGDGIRFKFTPSSQVLISVKDLMNEHGVLLIPRVTGKEVSDHTTKNGNHWYFTELIMEYEWINAEDPKDRFTVPWYGQGLDDGEKGVGKALTYAEKYLILKQFNIPTDKDDPDGIKPPDSKKQSEKPGTKSGDDKMSDADAKKEIGKLKNTLKKCDSDEKCSAWWKTNSVNIVKLPKNLQDEITKCFTDHRQTFFVMCPKEDPDNPKQVKRADCVGCKNEKGCPVLG